MWSAILVLWTTWGKSKEQLEASTHIDVIFFLYSGCSFMSIKCFFQYYYFCTHQIHTFCLFSPYVCRGTGAVLSWRLTCCMYSHPVKEQYVLLWPVLMKRPKSFFKHLPIWKHVWWCDSVLQCKFYTWINANRISDISWPETVMRRRNDRLKGFLWTHPRILGKKETKLYFNPFLHHLWMCRQNSQASCFSEIVFRAVRSNLTMSWLQVS